MRSSEVRKTFIDFFKGKEHQFAPPSPVVPQNDPTLLFINAGMNQFKEIFLGKAKPKFARAVNSQVCIRVSGKHNDLEEVGLDTTHLTLFEMLGNWSFGNYYKKEAISWAWELFTKVYNIPKNILYASVYEKDDESMEIWKQITDIDPTHILKFGYKENFWEMAETGPCGPCSEIHIDLGANRCDEKNTLGHVCKVNGTCGRFIELWNLVFIQYNREEDGSLTNLPEKHVDTGAGFERLCAYLQNTASNYETDLFRPIINKIEELSGKTYEDTIKGMPMRVMGDHIRTLTFAISDNVMPSNEGRGYVLRRLLRRALRYSKKLNISGPVLYKLVDVVVDIMGEYFENLPKRKEFIKQLVKAEEETFLKTLESGITLFEQIQKELNAKNQKVISGQDAFKLYDTFGFPIDLTQIMAHENNLTVDIDGFKAELEKQKNRSRSARQIQKTKTKIQPIGGEARLGTTEEEKIGIKRHHTSTHLLQAALRQVLGEHVYQAGSLVETDYLRFDFSHFKALNKEELTKVEDLIKKTIAENTTVQAYETEIAKAKADGAISLFGEKYEEIVRVIKIGHFSMELCGGNHIENTGAIEDIKILSESAISAGTRRIMAIAGKKNIENYFLNKKNEQINIIKNKQENINKLNQKIASLGQKIEPSAGFSNLESFDLETLNQKAGLITELIKSAEKKLSQAKNQNASKNISDLLTKIKPLGQTGINLFCENLENMDIPTLRSLSDNLLNQKTKTICILASTKDEKGLFFVKISTDLLNTKIFASNIIKFLTAIAGGSGGGKEQMAQAGGADPALITKALEETKTFLTKQLS